MGLKKSLKAGYRNSIPCMTGTFASSSTQKHG
jgi:hypothetical protein